MLGGEQKLYLGIFLLTYFVCSAEDFSSVYHNIHTVACTTYHWNVIAARLVSLDSNQGGVCLKDAFGTSIASAYNGRVNCTIDSTYGGMGVTVTFCFYNVTSSYSGTYRITNAGTNNRNGTVYVMDKPTAPQISPTTVEAGRQETMTCTSTSTSTPSPTGQVIAYTWTVNNEALSDPRYSNSSNTLTIDTVRREDKDNLFQCTAIENQGLSSETTGILLTVHYSPQGKPVISYSTLTHVTGSTVTLSCSITEDGNPKATWTWICGSRTFNSGITNSVGRSILTFGVTKTDNNKRCTCTSTSSVGPYNQTSDPALLDIRYPPQGKPVMSYSTLSYLTGSTVKLSCSIADDGNPQATWTWRCGSRTFNSGIINSVGQSSLAFVVTKTDNNQPCTCTASSSVGSYSQNSDPATLDIKYQPEGDPRFINPVLIHNESNTVSFTCSLTSNGNPPVSWIWTVGSRNFTSGYIINIGSRSTLRFQINRAENVKFCRCRAVSQQMSYDKFSEILIGVRYQPKINSLSVSSQDIIENDSISIDCVAEGNPYPTIQWINDDNKTTIKTDSNYGSASILRFNRIDCLDTATYKVMASNGYGYADSTFINISVLCKPRTVIEHTLTHVAAVGTDKKLNITFDFISHPMSDINWYFRQDKSYNNITLNMVSIATNTYRIGKVIYRTTLTRNLTSDEYGVYIAQLTNDLGYTEIEFLAVSRGPPDIPTELFLDCTLSNKATIHWIPGFNGIEESGRQIFTIKYKRTNEEYFIEDSQKFYDKTGSRIVGTVDGIASGTWIFAVQANNSLGLTTTSSTIACGIHDENIQENKSTLHGESVAVGFGIMLVIAIVPVAVIFIIKRRQQTEGKKNDLRMYDDLRQSVPNEPNYSQIQIRKDEATEYANTALEEK